MLLGFLLATCFILGVVSLIIFTLTDNKLSKNTPENRQKNKVS